MSSYRTFLTLLLLLVGILPSVAIPQTTSTIVMLPPPVQRPDLDTGNFGRCVAIAGDTVAVGTSSANWPDGSGDAAAYVYIRHNNQWVQQAKLRKADHPYSAEFASQLDISDNTLAVAAPLDSPPGSNHIGAVYVFTRQFGNWSQQARLILSDKTSRLGTGVAVEGDHLFAGRELSTPSHGRVDVYLRQGTTWFPQGSLQPVHHSTSDQFGTAISAEDDVVVIGARGAHGAAEEYAGAAFVFVNSGGGWSEQARLLAPDGVTSDSFGASVATDGQSIIVGAPGHGAFGTFRSGAAYVYRRQGDAWVFETRLVASDLRSQGAFGGRVSITNGVAIVGARGQGDVGAAYVFRWEGGVWREVSQLRPSDITGGGGFGTSVATDGVWGIVGRPERSILSGEAFFVPMPPPAPRDVTAQPQSAHEMRVNWTDPAMNEDGFEIWRKTGPQGVFGIIAAVPAEATSYLDTGLVASTTYGYQVRAYNGGGASVFGGPANATTPAGPAIGPAAPSGLTARALSKSAVRLTWIDQSTDELDFQLQRSLDGESFTDVEILPPDTATFSDDNDGAGLASGTAYHYRVRARGAMGSSPYTPIARASTLPDPPTAPDAFEATAVSTTRIDLAWRDRSSNESGFRIERKEGDTGSLSPYTEAGTVGAGHTHFADLGLTPGATYTYRLLAFNSGGESAPSSPASTATLSPPPAAPTDLAASDVTQTALTLTWVGSSAIESGFEVERRPGAVGSFSRIGLVVADGTQYRDSGLEPGTAYTYRVRALGPSGPSPYSPSLDVSTLPLPPAAPSDLTATVLSLSSLALSWSNSETGVTSLVLERRIAAAGFAPYRTLPPTANAFLDENLIPDTEYSYRLRALNGGGPSPYSNRAAARTLPLPPLAPGELRAFPLTSWEVRLHWVDRSSNESGFRIERRRANESFQQIALVETGAEHYLDSGLAPGTEYAYRLRAVNAGGDSPEAGPVCVTTLPLPPLTPNDLRATADSQTRIRLTWSDNSDTETGFEVERSRGNEPFTLLRTLPPDFESTSDSDLDPNTTYTYRVAAFNTGGRSPYTNRVAATTQPPVPEAPGELTAEGVSPTEIRLTWTDRSTGEAGFRIVRKDDPFAPATAFHSVAVVGAGVTTYLDRGLRPATLYIYRVQAYNAGGNSSYAGDTIGETFPNLPAAPNDLQVAAMAPNLVHLTWSDNSSTETGFEIERKTGGIAGPYSFTRIGTPSANTEAFTDTAVQPDSTYTYRVRAVNAAGASAYSSRVAASTPPFAPADPSAFTATPVSTTSIRLTWTDNSNNEEGFRLFRGRTGVPGLQLIATLAPNVMSHEDTGLDTSTTYVYQIEAFNRGGDSGRVTTTGTTYSLESPSELTVTVLSGGRARLRWKDNSNGETGFQIERKIGNGSFQVVGNVRKNVRAYLDTRLAAGQNYIYRVRASGKSGAASGYSNEAGILTPHGKRRRRR